MRIYLFCTVLAGILIGIPPVSGQSPYTLQTNTELRLVAVGAGLNIIGVMLKDEIDPFTGKELELLDHGRIPGFDRHVLDNYSPTAAHSSDLTRNICIAMPLLLAAGRPRSEIGKLGVLLGETYLLVNGVTFVAKTAFKRPRPFVYNADVPYGEKTKLNAQMSFFSGHTSISSGLSFFAAKVFSDYYPESKLKPVIWTVAAVVPAFTAYYRVKAGKHFVSDVIAGYLIGAAGGILVPAMHKTHRKASFGSVSMFTSGQDVGLVYRF